LLQYHIRPRASFARAVTVRPTRHRDHGESRPIFRSIQVNNSSTSPVSIGVASLTRFGSPRAASTTQLATL
jgi:hypothetical protein